MFLLVLITFFVGSFARAEANLTYQTLVETIESKNITSIEELLATLPASYLSGYTLMRKTQSKLQAADFKNPRAIVFGTDASLIMTFNGDPKQKGYDKLEVMQYIRGESRFELREITFPAKNGQLQRVTFSKPNPISCIGCHRADPRPIWDRYDQWSGAYGENDDLIKKGTEQYSQFLAFKKNAKTNPRYKFLQTFAKYPVYPYQSTFKVSDRFRPNLRLGQRLMRQNATRIARIAASDDVAKLILMTSKFNCVQPEEIIKKTKEVYALPAKVTRFSLTLDAETSSSGIDFYSSTGLFNAANIFENYLRIPVKDWSIQSQFYFSPIDPIQYDYYSVRDGEFELKSYVNTEILKNFAKENPELLPYVQIKTHPEYGFPEELNEVSSATQNFQDNPQKSAEVCAILNRLFRDALMKATNDGNAAAHLEYGNRKSVNAPLALSRCTSCHHTNSNAPIPLDDELQLKALVRSDKTFISNVEEMTLPDYGVLRMPLGENALLEFERSAIVEYLKSLE